MELRRPGDVFTEMAELMPSLKNITWERLVREGAVTYPVDDPHKPGNEIIFTTGFPTASGRGKIVPAKVIPPDELPDAEYPMVLSTGARARALAHRLDDPPRPGARPDRARGGGVHVAEGHAGARTCGPAISSAWKPGRGAIEVKVRADRDVPENMVFMPFCYAEAAANLLTNPALDPFGKIPEFKFCAARAEKIEIRTARRVRRARSTRAAPERRVGEGARRPVGAEQGDPHRLAGAFLDGLRAGIIVQVGPGEAGRDGVDLDRGPSSSIAIASVIAFSAVLDAGRPGRRSADADWPGRRCVGEPAPLDTLTMRAAGALRSSGSIALVDREHAEHIGLPHRAHLIERHVARTGGRRIVRDGLVRPLSRVRDRRVLDQHIELAEFLPDARAAAAIEA